MNNSDKGLVLIIDDNAANLKVISEFLIEAGHEVLIAKNGKSGLKKVKKASPDLILLDVRMPEMDGFEVCRRLKAWPDKKDIPVIFLTAVSNTNPTDKVKGLSLGAVDFIGKPILGKEVIARVNIHLRLRKLTQKLKDQNKLLQQEIKERQRSEEALRQSRQRLTFLIQRTPLAVIEWDRNFDIVTWNSAAERIFGYAQTEALGMRGFKFLMPESARDRFNQVLANLLLDPAPNRSTNEIVTKEGKTITCEWHMAALMDELGNTVGAAAVVMDISDRVAAEVSLQKAYQELQQEISDRQRAETTLQKLNKELQRLATLDSLTQVANRHRFDRYLDQEWRRLQREQAPLALLFCDVDRFKPYNDTYGHLAGDESLIRVAQAMTRTCQRVADLVARYGGEEFAIILPNTDYKGAKQVAEQIQQAVKRLKIPHRASGVSDYLTISIGIACVIPTGEAFPQDLIAQADAALYKAKTQGRDRAVCAQEGQ
ncbi:MAG: diguanylate cyclase [Jaaginema sp. PMC 1079.18]|nr:diguanylate cyclase [Jaaginema sp. PMC 1080.18]MEC4850810.1 diguanylate cyclase [Jaaginema sp. PMC 1079.18]MEC4867852.1 diguanylate cyclase [Jaaginema sp. PMC 1078.18]